MLPKIQQSLLLIPLETHATLEYAHCMHSASSLSRITRRCSRRQPRRRRPRCATLSRAVAAAERQMREAAYIARNSPSVRPWRPAFRQRCHTSVSRSISDPRGLDLRRVVRNHAVAGLDIRLCGHPRRCGVDHLCRRLRRRFSFRSRIPLRERSVCSRHFFP